MKKRPRLRLVSKADAGKRTTDIFDDMDALRAAEAEAKAKASGQSKRRPKPKQEQFSQIPLERGIALYRRHIGDAGWAILIELTYRAYKGDNPSLLNSERLNAAGVTGTVRQRALQRLVEAGLIGVEPPTGPGKAPLVTLLWCRVSD
jgi:hypothetical protein